MVSPGVEFLVHNTLHGLSKLAFIGTGLYYSSRYFFPEISFSPLVAILVSIASVPVHAAARDGLRYWRQKREAAALGARLAPCVRGKWPGNLDIMRDIMNMRLTGYPGDAFVPLIAKYGPIFNTRILWVDHIFTVSPDHLKTVLATNFDTFQKGPYLQGIMRSVLGNGIFNSDGEQWKYHRNMSRPFFARDRVRDFDTLDAHAAVVLSILKSHSQSGTAVDFQDLIGRFTMDSASELLFGKSVDSLKGGGGVDADGRAENSFLKGYTSALAAVGMRDSRRWLWPLWELRQDGTKEGMEAVRSFLSPIIAVAVERKRARAEAEKTEAQNLLDELVNSTEDREVLMDEMVNILLAGRDTTMHTLTMVIYFLSIYPSISQRLRTEILDQVGSTRRPTYEDIRDMKYLRAVINETLRLYPPVPANLRQSINATTLPSPDPNDKPIYVPAQTTVLYSPLLMQRRKDLWGPDADEFDPDRFLDTRLKEYLLTNSFQFLPFNAGPRICLGQQFAYNEMSFMLIRLLQSFAKFELAEDAVPPDSDARPPVEWRVAQGRKAVERFVPKVHLTMSAKRTPAGAPRVVDDWEDDEDDVEEEAAMLEQQPPAEGRRSGSGSGSSGGGRAPAPGRNRVLWDAACVATAYSLSLSFRAEPNETAPAPALYSNAHTPAPMPAVVMASSSAPIVPLAPAAFQPQMRILKRSPNATPSPSATPAATPPGESLKEREARYAAARERIFGKEDTSPVVLTPEEKKRAKEREKEKEKKAPSSSISRNPKGPSDAAAGDSSPKAGFASRKKGGGNGHKAPIPVG
ncbi:Cytochrome P450 [Mycena chlorophos]|uniref:Cytochrome P450 n=1 Tax=Mycena chlorophos TaxID=658473 RepID=A0A8H6WAR3_MYCCL|nr:Cytochrome P450 [Mycena chlorophos]